MNIIEIIRKKRDGEVLNERELEFFANAAAKETVPDYQLSAMLMAVYLKGLNENETAILTQKMADSGERLDLSGVNGPTVDKHSTGGVGDKTTIIVAPVAAALGCKVAKMSGRGLGHTGGTIDKFESIPGFNTNLTSEAFINQVNKIGLAVVGSNKNLAPADKKLYALRDVTATVDNIPLIASSIMSKKLAAGAKNIVLDVKYGSGAFMKTKADAEHLADVMIKIGTSAGRNTSAVISDMSSPLGCAVGNSIEVCEAVDVLKNKIKGRLYDVSVELASKMYSLCFGASENESVNEVKKVIENGKAYKKLCDMVEAQGGDCSVLCERERFFKPLSHKEIKAKRSGTVTAVDALTVGRAACAAGAGRLKTDDIIDPSAGIIMHVLPGESVSAGDTLMTIYGSDEKLKAAKEIAVKAVLID